MAAKVVVAGATGFIGSALVPSLNQAGYEVVALVRGSDPVRGARAVTWDGKALGGWAKELREADAIVNLAGEPIGQRWSVEARERILRSRLDSAKAIGEAIRDFSTGLRWINASAVGYYGDRSETPVTETALPGTGFLAETCVQWEQAVLDAAPPYATTIRVRTGMVLSPEGGALPVLLRLARYGLGGTVGHGRQGVSWIHRDDLVEMILWLLTVESPPPVVNGTTPNPVSNREFMRAIRKEARAPIGLPAPAFAVRLVGQTGGPPSDLVLDGVYALPEAALRGGFGFSCPTLDEALG